MLNLIEYITNLKESDYYEHVNLHIHTCCSDGKLNPDEVIKAALDQKLQAISITDHNSVEAYEKLEYQNIENLKLINGVEFDCWDGLDLLHILGYGIDLKNEKIQKLCSKNHLFTRYDLVRFFNSRKAKDVIYALKEAGGIAILAHPACCWSLDLKKMIEKLKTFGLDGIEVYYPYVGHRGFIKFSSIKNVKKIAEKLGMIITGGADSHGYDLRSRK